MSVRQSIAKEKIMKILTKLVLMSTLVVGGNRASEAAEWIEYDGVVPSNAVYSTNYDRGAVQEGWPVCRYRKTVGWFDTDSSECHTMGQRVVAQRSADFYMLVQPAGDGMLLHSATEKMVTEPGWVPYENDDSAATADLVTTDNYDRGDKQEGWTVCRWRRSVGYVDDQGVCKSVNNRRDAVEHSRDFYVYRSAPDFNDSLPATGRGIEWYSLSDYMGESANGANDNTASFQRAFRAMADNSVYKLFVPAGHYRIDEANELLIPLTQGISLYGSSIGVSLIAPFAQGSPAGNVLIFGERRQSLSFYGLYFQNVKFKVRSNCTPSEEDKTVYQNNVFISHGTMYATGGIISESAGCQSRIRGNIFLGSSLPSGEEGRPAYGHSPTIKTVASSIHVVENVFGLNMDDLGWLAEQWEESGEWTNLPHKLGYLKDTLGLDSDMAKFFCVLNSGGFYADHEIVFERNIVNASPETVGEDGTDHVLYLKGPDDARIVGNYFRGFKEDYVKFSGARNSVVAFNNFDGPGLALYIENCRSDREGSGKLNELSNLLIYENRLSLNDDEQLRNTNFYTYNYCTGSRTSFNGGWGDYATHRFAGDPVVEEDMIQYAYNSKAGSEEVGIYLKANNSFPEAHLMYDNNVDILSNVMGEISPTSEESEFIMPDYADWLNTHQVQVHPDLSLPKR